MQQPGTLSIVARIAVALVLAACASNPASDGGATPGSADAVAGEADAAELRPKSGRITPPQRVDRTRLDLRLSGPIPTTTSGRGQLALDISVDIDVDGRPDMRTLKVTGPSAPENRDAVARWIEGGSFRAAKDGSGRPVRAAYRTRLRVRAG